MPLDSKYYVPSKNDLEKAIEETVVDEIKYCKSKFDCESFAMYFHSKLALEYGYNACGIVFSLASGHAFNILLAHEEEKIFVSIFEPQTDQIIQPEYDEEDKDISLMDNIVSLLKDGRWHPENNAEENGNFIIEDQTILI